MSDKTISISLSDFKDLAAGKEVVIDDVKILFSEDVVKELKKDTSRTNKFGKKNTPPHHGNQ